MTLRAPLPRDAVSASRYRFIAKLGQGGMADVFLAIQLGLKGFRRLSVVKQLRSDMDQAPDFLAMFQDEARLAARLNHPNIVHTYEVGHDRAHHFISMEFLRGQTYAQLFRRVGRESLDFAISLRILIETLKGLDYAHQLQDLDGTPLGIVHRDISPSNIFITYDGRIKILDFGIAKALGSSVETQAGMVKGKVAYMPPEQATGTNVGPRTDLYAVGVMLWEAAARARRWAGYQDIVILSQLLKGVDPVPPHAQDYGLPPVVDAICLRALAANPAERYESAAEFRQELEELLATLPAQPSAEEVGRLVTDSFRVEAEELQELIEAQLKKLKAGEEPTIASMVSFKTLGESSDVSHFRPNPTLTGAANSRSWAHSLYRKLRRRPAVALGMGAIVGLLAFWLATQGPVPTPTVQSQRALGAATLVSVRVAAIPPEAKLYWDGTPLKSNPHVATLPRSDQMITLSAEADGFASASRGVLLNADREIVITLVPSSQPVKKDPPVAPSASAESAMPEKKTKPPTRATARRRVATRAKNPSSKPVAKKPRVKLDTSDPWAN